MKLNKAQFAFLFIVALMFAYLISGVVLLLLNGYDIKQAFSNYSVSLSAQAMLNNYPRSYEALLYSFLGVSPLIFGIPLIPQKQKLHGDARFANAGEIRSKMNLMGDQGIIIGKLGKQLLRYPGDDFVSLAAGTGFGKGVSVVIPNLLEWKESAVVMDIKNENFAITSKYRKEVLKQEVYYFNPYSLETDRYNPLTYIDMNDKVNRDIQLADIANMLYPLTGKEESIHFNGLAQSLFIGVCYMWYDLYSSRDGQALMKELGLDLNFSLAGILDIQKNISISYEDDGQIQSINNFDEIIKYLDFIKILSPETKRKLSPYLSIQSDREKGSVESTFVRPLLFFHNSVIRNATSHSDFDLREIRKKRMTIYVAITPDQLENAKPILNLFWQQLISLNTKELPENDAAIKYHVLMLMDEFTSIGYMPVLHTSVSFIRGYWLRLLIIYQNNSQLEEHIPRGYGKDGAKTILSNHKCKIYFAQEETADAEQLSKKLGNKTLRHTNRSYSSSSKHGGTTSRNVNEVKRPLMLPQEIQELDNEKEIITITTQKPILCNKAFYYKDSYFMNKLKKVSPTLRSVKGIPSRDLLKKALQKNELAVKLKRKTS